MSLKRVIAFIRDPLIEKIVASLIVAAILGFVAWFVGVDRWKAVWLYLREPVEVWRGAVCALLVSVIVLATLLVRGYLKKRPLHSDPNDIVAILTAWVGNRPAGQESDIIYFSKLDNELRLVPGSTKQFIERAAHTYHLAPATRGPNTIILRHTR